jgi:prepilin-type N-terminal cleavage/methylation domain-containing protein
LHTSPNERGFSLLEALVVVAVSAALLGLVVDVLSSDALQTRRFVSRSEAAVEMAQGRRAFAMAAPTLRGSGTDKAAGNLRIEAGRLVLVSGQSVQTLWRWENGRAAFAYSEDGVSWRPVSSNVTADSIRFTWQDRGREMQWLVP